MTHEQQPTTSETASTSAPMHVALPKQPLPLAVYIEHSDLPDQHGKNPGLRLCTAIENILPNSTLGSQFYNGVWSIWLKSQKAYQDLFNVDSFELDNTNISLHKAYPVMRYLPNERVVIKDLPFWVPNEEITNFLKDQPGITIKSSVQYAYLRDTDNKLTPFLSGDRFVYIRGNISQALPDKIILDYNTCRVSHKTQSMVCARCRKPGHSHNNTDMCRAFCPADDSVVTIRSPKFVLCNYYPCYLKVSGNEFTSLEQAYQWRFVTYVGMTELADEILRCNTPAQAKEIARRVPRHLHRKWHSIKLTVMKDILHAKADYCPKFKETLIKTEGKRIVESTSDVFWSTGVPPYDSITTLPSYYPGKNHLGRLMEQVRAELIQEAELAAQLLTVDTPPPADIPTTLAVALSITTVDPTTTNSTSITTPDPTSITTTTSPDNHTPTATDDNTNTQDQEEQNSSENTTTTTNNRSRSSSASSVTEYENSDIDEDNVSDIDDTDSLRNSSDDVDYSALISGIEPLTSSPNVLDNDNPSITDINNVDTNATDLQQQTILNESNISVNPAPQLIPKPLPRCRSGQVAHAPASHPKNPQSGPVTIIQMFDKMKKRKMTPNKEADTTRDYIKVQRSDNNT